MTPSGFPTNHTAGELREEVAMSAKNSPVPIMQSILLRWLIKLIRCQHVAISVTRLGSRPLAKMSPNLATSKRIPI